MDRFGDTDTLVVAFATTNRTLFLLAEARLREAGIRFYRHEEVTTFPCRRGNQTSTSGFHQIMVRASDAEEAWAVVDDLPQVSTPSQEPRSLLDEPPPVYAPDGRLSSARRWALIVSVPAAAVLLLGLLLAGQTVLERVSEGPAARPAEAHGPRRVNAP